MKNKITTIVIIIATVILAGIAVFTAIRLYQLRQQAVAPTAPESKPEAAAPRACTALTFNLSVSTPTSTPTPTATATATATATPTATPTTVAAATATPTSASLAEEPSLPDAGTSFPTIIGVGLGILLLIGALLLAL